MKMRILTGLVGGALAFVVLLLLPPIFLNIAMSVICGVAMYEVLIVSRFVGHRGLTAAAVVFAMLTPFFLLPGNILPATGAMLLYVEVLTFLQIKYHETLSVERIGFVFFISVVFPLAFSCLAYLRTYSLRGSDADGLFYVFLALVIPWMCDMGAYFVGTFLGKHKMCPGISPKKHGIKTLCRRNIRHTHPALPQRLEGIRTRGGAHSGGKHQIRIQNGHLLCVGLHHVKGGKVLQPKIQG